MQKEMWVNARCIQPKQPRSKGLALPDVTSSVANFSWPFSHATHSGVRPSLSALSTSAASKLLLPWVCPIQCNNNTDNYAFCMEMEPWEVNEGGHEKLVLNMHHKLPAVGWIHPNLSYKFLFAFASTNKTHSQTNRTSVSHILVQRIWRRVSYIWGCLVFKTLDKNPWNKPL